MAITLLPQYGKNVRVTFLTKLDDRSVPSPRVRLHQVHGNRTIVARGPMESTEQADGVITDVPNLTLTVRAADCQNFAVYAPEKNVGGVLHAGWRGIILGAIPEFFATLKKEFAIDPEETFVVAGPSLCVACAEYKDPEFELRQKIDARFVVGDCVDLQGAATMQLLEAGVPRDHCTRHSDCTKCNPASFLTYRGGDKTAVQNGESNVLTLTLLG